MQNKITVNIPFFNAAQVNSIFDFSSAAQRVIDSHWYILGQEVSCFEKEFSDYLNTKHCISVANGTDALEIALKAIGIKHGDKVVTTANAGFYSSTAIYALGAEPIYVDIDPISLTMCPIAFASALSQNPKAVIITHLYGQLSPAIDEITALAKKNNILVLEDCAQAHGARKKDRQAGAFGDIACFSFYPTKNLGALGDGGAIVTSNDDFALKAKQLRQYGWTTKYHVTFPGGRNSRLDELQAAFLRLKLPFLDRDNQERRRIAQRYNDMLASLPLQLPAYIDDSYVAHLYVVQTKDRDGLAAYLKSNDISCDIHYPIPDHQQGAYTYNKVSNLTVTEKACNAVLSLPCYPRMDESHIEKVVNAIRTYFSKG